MNDVVVIRNCPKLSARKAFKLETVIKSPEREREAHHAKLAAESAQADAGAAVPPHMSHADAASSSPSASS